MTTPVNTITTNETKNALAREVEFTQLFAANVKKLMEALGVTRKIAKKSGETLYITTATGTLQSGNVDEGDVIPLSQYSLNKTPFGTIKLKKWRKATSAESIIENGYDAAVQKTTDKMLTDVQAGVRTNFFNVLSSAAGKSSVSAVGLQATVAKIWAKLQNVFEDNTIESVYFINPDDIADYLGAAQITTQNVFGMKYIEDFMGMGTVIFNSSVPKGKVLATAKDNLVLYYVPVNGADLDEVFSFTADETGLIGIHELANYVNMTAEDVVVSGLTLAPEVALGCVIGTISAAAAAA